MREDASEADCIRAQKDLAHSVESFPHDFDLKIIRGNDVVRAILHAATGYDLIVIGATNEPLFKTLLLGNIPEQVARQAKVTTVMVKRGQGPVRSFLRETLLLPATRDGFSANSKDRQPAEEMVEKRGDL